MSQCWPIRPGYWLPAALGIFQLNADTLSTESSFSRNLSPPSYPLKAFRKCVEGSVTLSIVINNEGIPLGIHVLEENPEGYGFGRYAIRGMQRQKFNFSENKPGIPFEFPVTFTILDKASHSGCSAK